MKPKEAKQSNESKAVKSSNAMKAPATQTTASNPDTVIRVIKTATCPSLSGESQLTYHVGCNAAQELFFTVVANTGGGMFSQEWVSLAAIQKALGKAGSDKELTSFLLYPLFSGKSQNSPGFVFAALQSEGLVSASTTKRRCYELTEWAPFQAAMQAWAASGQGPKLEERPAQVRGKGVKPVKLVPTAAVWGEGAAVSATLPAAAVDIVPIAAPEVPAVSVEKLSAMPTSSTPVKTRGKTTVRAKRKA